MKKSLFTKLMTTYFIVMVISYILVAFFVSYWFTTYYYGQKASGLIREGEKLYDVVFDYVNGKISADRLQFELSVTGRFLSARISVVDNYGYPWGSSENNTGSTMEKQLTDVDIDDVRRGEIVVRRGSFTTSLTTPMLTVGIPVFINGQVRGGIYLQSPVNEIKSALKRIYTVIWITASLAIIISTVIIYYFSDRILIKPIGKINETARSIAKGEFDRRVSLKSEDEVGDLAVSFNYMADSLQNLENVRRNFIANISHELRSPITSINGFISGMLDGTVPEEKWHHYLGIVNDETKRLIRLINDILDLTRLESGEFSLRMGAFDINELICERIIKFEDRINRKAVDVSVDLVESRVMAKGDRDRIDQVITNLLDNALKFVPQGGNIKVHNEIKQDRILISVYNNGPAIPKEEIKYIWDRFHKADKARSKGGGTGLGLSIARQIINQHNETIWAESGDFGTRFTFTLSIV